jgi:flap endonuclease-1
MGINNLKNELRSYNLVKKGHISQFSQQKGGLDISSYIYKFSKVFVNNWLNCIPNFVAIFKKYNVHPTFIFDGKAPQEKDKERQRRRNCQKKSEEKTENIREDLIKFKNNEPPSDLLKEVMKKINDKKKGGLRLLMLKNETEIDIEKIEEYILERDKQATPIKKEDVDTLKELLTKFGIPLLNSSGEAEALCAKMFNEKQFDFVITEDSDILAYGVEYYISDLNTLTGECEIIRLSEVLNHLKLDFNSFQEFCVMCGCDYNDNIPNIGIKNCLLYIQKHKNINNVITFLNTDFNEKLNKENKKLNENINEKKKDEIIKRINKLKNQIHFMNNEFPFETSLLLFKNFGRILETYKSNYWDVLDNLDNAFNFMYLQNIKYNKEKLLELWQPVKMEFCEE